MRVRVPRRLWIGIAERRTRNAETLARKLFDLSEAEAQVEKELLEEKESQLENELGINDEHDAEVAEGQVDIAAQKEDISEGLIGVGRLCLVYLEHEMRGILRFLLREYGTSEQIPIGLPDLAVAYEESFGIQFSDAPINYEHVQELSLARNCIVHEESFADQKYISVVRHRVLLDEDRKIVVDRERFEHCSSVFSQFLGFVIRLVATKKGLGEK